MVRLKLKKILEALNLKIKSLEDQASKTNESANEIAKAASGSWSQAGDREHSRNQAELVKDTLVNLKNLKVEVEEVLEEKIPSIVSAPCYVEIDDNGEKRAFYLVSKGIYLKDFAILSTESKQGKEIVGKRIGDKTSFGKIVFIG